MTFKLVFKFVILASLLVFSVSATSAQRIVALAPHIVEMLYEVGAGELIVGTVDYSDYPSQATEIPRIGGYYGIQIEKVLALKPDLVIAWQSGNKSGDIDQLKRLGLNVIYSQPNDLLDIAKEFRLFGKLTNNTVQAELIAAQYEKELSSLKTKYSARSKVDTFYQLWSEPMMTISGNTWINQLINVCAGHNVFANSPSDYPQIGIENVVVAAPAVIIIPNEKSDKPQPTIDWSKWSVIPAVKNNQFIHVDADLLHRFSSRMLLGLDDMCQKMDNERSVIRNLKNRAS